MLGNVFWEVKGGDMRIQTSIVSLKNVFSYKNYFDVVLYLFTLNFQTAFEMAWVLGLLERGQ